MQYYFLKPIPAVRYSRLNHIIPHRLPLQLGLISGFFTVICRRAAAAIGASFFSPLQTTPYVLPLFVLVLYINLSFGQNPSRIFNTHQQDNNYIKIQVSDGQYQIRFYTEDIVETQFIPTGEALYSNSHAVIALPTHPNITTSETTQDLQYSTKGICIKIIKSPFQIIYYRNNKEIVSEKLGYQKTSSGEKISFNLSEKELLYGAGARVLGMNRRGNKLKLYNRAHYGYENRAELMNYTLPIAISSEQYLIHFDNPATGELDFDSEKNNTLSYETTSGKKCYQLVTGNSWEYLITNYTWLTGRQPLPPRWAFGNFASRFGYHSQKEAENTLQKFHEKKIPVDAIILDLYWFGKDIKGTMGNLEVFRDSFPKFEKMMARFKKKGVNTIPITEPFILTTSKRWQEAVNQNILATNKEGKPFTYDFYFGNTGLIDIFNPHAQDWFWNIYKNLAIKGAAGVWGDLGEPEVHPAELYHGDKTANEVHNIYGHQWAKVIFEGYKKDLPATRPFILMRSGYSGSQRYGMIPWSGDVNRTWGGLSGQTEIALQMGLQGLGYMHSDLGGFAGANMDDELYVRWLQYGVFQPIFRPHAQEEVPSEPVFRNKETLTLAKKAIEMRYAMLPYNYTLAFENSTTGIPLMRPMFFEEPDNSAAYTTSSQYFWGKDFLVAPILESGAKSKTIYFPKTDNWYDFHKGIKYDGGSTHSVPLVSDHIPVFVRGGAIIPLINPISSTALYSKSEVSFHYFYDPDKKDSTAKFYDDDGQTPDAFQKGAAVLYHLNASQNENIITIDIRAEKGVQYPSAKKKAKLIVQHVAQPQQVLLNGKKCRYIFNQVNKTIEIPFKLCLHPKTNFQIQF